MSRELRKKILKEHVQGVLDDLNIRPPAAFLEQIYEIITFRTALTEETDRGCALMAASFLEHRTGELLKSFFVADENLHQSLLNGNGPLSSFSSRIDVAYSVGVIPKMMRNDLHLLRKIRNEFAHTPEEINFQTPSIADRCRILNYAGTARTTIDPRESFIRAMMGIDGSIFVKMLSLQNVEPLPDEDFGEREQMFEVLMAAPIKF